MLSRVFKEDQTSRNSDRSEATPKYRRHLSLDICPRRSDPMPLHHGIEGGGLISRISAAPSLPRTRHRLISSTLRRCSRTMTLSSRLGVASGVAAYGGLIYSVLP